MEPSFFSSKKWIKLIPKTIGNRKKRLCVRLRSGDRHHLRKSADRKAQIRKAFVVVTGLICAFRSADFLRWCLSPERNLTHNLFFLFPIVFGINYSLGTNSTGKPSSSWEWPNLRFTRFFRTWRTEGPQKNNLQADGLQWISPRGRGSSLSMRQWTMIEAARQKCQKTGSSPDLCSESVKMKRAEILQRKFTKADFWEGQRPDSRSLVGSSWTWWLKKPTTTVQAVMNGESYFINIQLWEDFFDFLRGKMPGTLEIQADSEKNRW